MKIFFIKLVGFFVGALFLIAAEAVLIVLYNTAFDKRFFPRGPGWSYLPILFGIGLAQVFPDILSKMPKYKDGLIQQLSLLFKSKNLRNSTILLLLWIFSIVSYMIVFEPYGYLSSKDYNHIAKIMFFPPFILGVTYIVLKRTIFVAKK